MKKIMKNQQYKIYLIILSIVMFFIFPTNSDENTFKANWRDTEINDFLKGMSGIINKNILLDDSLKGKKITIISREDIPVKNALSFMKSVLESLGFAVIEEENLIKVVKLKDALTRSQIVRVGKDLIPDSELSQNKIVTQIITLEYNKPEDLEPILKRLTSKETDVIIHKNTDVLVLSGASADINRLLKIINELDVKVSDASPGKSTSAGDIHIYTLEYHEAEKIAAVLIKLDNPIVSSSSSGAEDSPEGERRRMPPQNTNKPPEKIKAVAHKESNSVIVTAKSDEWSEIKKIIQSLDSSRKQVLLEVLIVELTGQDLNDFGIDWRASGTTGGLGQFNTGLAQEGNIVDSNGQIRPSRNTLSGFSLGFLQSTGGNQIFGILNANAGNENFNVISAPQVLTLDNQEASINVGQDVPVRTQSRNSGGGPNTVTIDSFEYKPTGINLKFTPHVNKNDKVTLELFQEIKNIAQIGLSGGNPTFNTREVKTTISVDNKQTIVIGGLISQDKEKRIIKLPILGSIPLIGYLFKRTTTRLKKTNLLVFLTPHVFSTRDEASKVTTKKKLEYDELLEERERQINPEKRALDYVD